MTPENLDYIRDTNTKLDDIECMLYLVLKKLEDLDELSKETNRIVQSRCK